MENLEIYNKYKEVPENALKSFNNGKFSGTDINTMWRIKSLTEAFGVCGIGWYYDIVRTWTENAPNDEVLAFAEIKLFIKNDNEWSKGISAVGGSKIVQYFKTAGYSNGNDEGFKMAITDALGVACKLLGFGADIYWANDKTKYTNNDNNKVKPKKEVEKITQQQISKLEEFNTNFTELCKYYKKTKVGEITFWEAEQAINAKIKEHLKNLDKLPVVDV